MVTFLNLETTYENKYIDNYLIYSIENKEKTQNDDTSEHEFQTEDIAENYETERRIQRNIKKVVIMKLIS